MFSSIVFVLVVSVAFSELKLLFSSLYFSFIPCFLSFFPYFFLSFFLSFFFFLFFFFFFFFFKLLLFLLLLLLRQPLYQLKRKHLRIQCRISNKGFTRGISVHCNTCSTPGSVHPGYLQQLRDHRKSIRCSSSLRLYTDVNLYGKVDLTTSIQTTGYIDSSALYY